MLFIKFFIKKARFENGLDMAILLYEGYFVKFCVYNVDNDA